MADLTGTENKKDDKKEEKDHHTPPTQPERGHPAVEVSPKLSCGAISLGRHPSYQRNPKMAQKMNVPPSRSKTS